jgi:hypothetical protein
MTLPRIAAKIPKIRDNLFPFSISTLLNPQSEKPRGELFSTEAGTQIDPRESHSPKATAEISGLSEPASHVTHSGEETGKD